MCEHCDHFVCFECEKKHRTTAKVDTQSLVNKWQECKNKYNILLQKLSNDFLSNGVIDEYLFSSTKKLAQYKRDRSLVDSDLAAIRVAVETRTQTALQAIMEQRDCLIGRIDEHIKKEQAINKYVKDIH